MIDQKLLSTKLGTIAISAAAVDDVVAWCLFALIISLLSSGVNKLAPVWMFLVLIAHVLVILFVVKPLYTQLSEYMNKRPVWRSSLFAYTAVLIFVSAFFTEAVGVHAVFGGFLMGLAIPRVSLFQY
jgi:Kef-type K+ transport system membrane component KefB